ncbi:MAG: SPFH domain-containing protein [Candidatus Woesebacteria bacterium]|jgi:regulator of protease activity HflC (stomatin/prohibitin superfamily)
MPRNTNSVQTFIRTAIFLVVLGILVLVSLPIAALISIAEAGSLVTFAFLGVDIWLALTISKMFYVLPEWERLVLLKMGKFAGVKGPGYFLIPPFIYSVADIVDTRIVTQQVEATATLTKDNVPTRVTAAIEFEVENPQKAVINVKNYLSSIIWLSTEALKNTIGSMDLKDLLSNRDEIASQLKQQIDSQAVNYGVNVRAVRITDIDTPPELVEELAVIARARRASEAKQIQAEAEVAVAKKMTEASQILAKQEGGFRLREIQNLAEMSKEESAMIIVYPYESDTGKSIASASVSLRGRVKKK